MDVKELCFVFLLLCISISESIKCKCTKESETVQCYDGICEIEGGSCLMLDHPTIGVHYTCHTKGLKDGVCRNKTSKSGAAVRICGCDQQDFCNYSYWAEKTTRSVSSRDSDKESARQKDESTPPTDTAQYSATVTLVTALTLIRAFF